MSHHFNPDNKQHFYDHYFDRELPDNEVYQYDVGSYCTRRLICSHLHQQQGAVLEVGTGVSSLLADLQQFACFGIDISPRTIEGVRRLFAQKGLQADLRVASAELLPFDACSFDAIVSSHTFEHVENDHSAIKECARVLKPGGELILFVPGRVSGVATHEEFLRLGHYRMYNAKRMQEFEAITNYALRLKTLAYPHKMHNMVWNRMKHACRWINYPVKKWLKRDYKTYELRPTYQRFILPAVAGILDRLDAMVMHTEKPFFGNEFNVLARFEKNA